MEGKVNPNTVKKLRMKVETQHNWFYGMKRIKIQGKDLGTLPIELFTMIDIEVLDLSPERETCLEFRLTKLPNDIGKMANLKVLMLDTNDLRVLPDEIVLLSHLEWLSLSNNKISRLPDGMDNLETLTSLHLANNRFTLFPQQIVKLSKLEHLDLCDNKLTSLPENIGLMKNLIQLLLYRNRIVELPESICDLQKLQTFWIGENKLERLPRRFTDLQSLDWGKNQSYSSEVEGNPLLCPPVHICKQGIDAIGTFFMNYEEDGSDCDDV